MFLLRFRLALLASGIVGLLACGAPAAAVTPRPGPTAQSGMPAATNPAPGAPTPMAVPSPTAAPTSLAVTPPPPTVAPPAPTPVHTPAPAPGGQVSLELGQSTVARYRVREQLAGANLPNDAVGETTAVKGQLVLGPGNAIIGDASKFTVDLGGLRSDETRRDNYVRRSALDTAQFPTAEFVLRELRGLAAPLPASGAAQFQLVGDMTVHGVTSSLVWDATAIFTADGATGKATTGFPFSRFEMQVPRVALVLSLEDNIRLELDFRLVKGG